MAISIVISKHVYSGDNSNKDFPYDFRIDDQSWLKVWVTVAGVWTLLTYSSDYTLTGIGSDSGGTVTTTSAPETGTNNVVVERVTPETQTVGIPEGGPFLSAVIEREISDKLEMQIQDLHTKFGSATANKLVKWDERAQDLVVANSAIMAQETTDVSAALAAGQGMTYFKGNKFIIAYNDSGTFKYRYIDLTATANPPVWVYTTSAP